MNKTMLKTMRVFRVEHESELDDDSGHYLGPFHINTTSNVSGISTYCCFDTLDFNPFDHPIPSSDGISIRFDSYETVVCGTISLADIETWFPCEVGRHAMKNEGFVLREYEVEMFDDWIGGTQCVFDFTKATMVQLYDLEDLMREEYA